jgi:hypothetical protein
MEARIPTIETTTINSTSVKPEGLERVENRASEVQEFMPGLSLGFTECFKVLPSPEFMQGVRGDALEDERRDREESWQIAREKSWR